MSSLLLHLLLLLLVTITSGDPISRDSTIPIQCSPFDCGNGLSIHYPFWHIDDGHRYCGYPSLGVSCDAETRKPLLRLPGDTYYVEEIDYYRRVVTLVDGDVAGKSCPRVRKNVDTFSLLGFSLADKNHLFFFNCSPLPSSVELEPISCLKDKNKRSFVILEDKIPAELDWHGKCDDTVVASVTRDSDLMSKTSLTDHFFELLHIGFKLKWSSAQTCRACEESLGFCGYSNATRKPLCFCKEGTYAKSCNDGTRRYSVMRLDRRMTSERRRKPRKKKPERKEKKAKPTYITTSSSRPEVKTRNSKSKKKIAIGVGCGVGGFLVACLLSFLVQKYLRQRRQAASKTLLSQNFSPDPSSKRDLEECPSILYTHIFSYKELEEATNNFDSSRELGDGGFGTVYLGKLQDGRSVAVKRLYENNYKRVEQFMNEVKILSSLRHENLVTLYGCTSRHSRELLLVYEFIPNGTVADHLHGDHAQKGALTWPIRMNVAIETAESLAYLHAFEPPIIHRDVKTNNILLDSNLHVKVADFGLSRLFPLDVTHVSTTPQGTPGYVDPDYHKCYQLTDKSDVYSFGVVLMEIISSKPAVDITRHRQEINLAIMAINKIHNGALHELVDPNLGFDTDYRVKKMITLVAELGFRCLQEEKDMRPSMVEVVEVLKGIKREEDETKKKTSELDTQMNDVGLLKTVPPFSPDSVMDNWGSKSTTPNASA
ncbi:LEAF RUST 10 DISEASE-RESISTANCEUS RECEPTOR-LIKE PROTEIN KINASE-like 1.2 isoform X1 [Aristolochia californica]|uniref:LEAF RUST 10 DISEASE-RESISTANCEUS RECEPTOR-LIKE PROTEIN KINASE-like 1.2 isoform X1 n=1 Tax=Aristolochia californica TaxID=171875 RepID=UPI0035E24B71